MSATLYGLTSCDTCRKARNWLDRSGIAYEFVDYRARPLAPEALRGWADQLGGFDRLINRASTTWRNLPPARRAPGSTPEWLLLLKEHPALIKRPVLVTADGTVSLGFTDKAYRLRFGSK